MSDKIHRPSSLMSVASTDGDDGHDLFITVDTGVGEDTSDHASFSFIPLAGNSPMQRKRRSFSTTKASELSASPSGASTPTGAGKLDLAAKRRVHETPADIENSYFRQFWSRYLKGYERALISDILNKFLKDLATSSSSYDNGEAFSSEELIKFFRPPPRGKGDKLRESLDPNGSSAIGPLKLDSVLRRFGKHATSRDLLVALAEGGGPRIWIPLKSNVDGKSSLRHKMYAKLCEYVNSCGIFGMQCQPGCGASTEIQRSIQQLNDDTTIQETLSGDSVVSHKIQPIIYVDLNYCHTWQEAVWYFKVHLGFEGGNVHEALHHLIVYFSAIFSGKVHVLLVIDNTQDALYPWLYKLFSTFVKSGSVVIIGRHFESAVDVHMINITIEDQLHVAEYYLEQEALKAEASLVTESPVAKSPEALFDNGTVKTIVSLCTDGNLNILRFLLSCPANEIRHWIASCHDVSDIRLSGLSIFDEIMMQYLYDISPILSISAAGLCQWFYSDTFDSCSTIDKFTQDECLSILRRYGLLEINKNLFRLNLPSYLLQLVDHDRDGISRIHNLKDEELKGYEIKLKSYWSNVMKHIVSLATSLADSSSGGSIANDPTSIDPLALFAESDLATAAYADRSRGPVASLAPLLPQIRLLLLNLVVAEPSSASEIPYEAVTWSFLLPSGESQIYSKVMSLALQSAYLPRSLREAYLLNESFISAIVKILHVIGTDEEVYSYLLRLRQAQAACYQQQDFEAYSMYPDRSLTQEAPKPAGERATEWVILAMISCLIRLQRFDDADKLITRCLPSMQEERKKQHEIEDSLNLSAEAETTDPGEAHPDQSSRAVVSIDDDTVQEDLNITTSEFEHGHIYHENYIFPESSLADFQGMWLKGCSHQLRCMSQTDSFEQLALFNPLDKKVLMQQFEREGADTKPKESPILILDSLLDLVDASLSEEIENANNRTGEDVASLSSESLLFVLKLKTMLLQADHQTAYVLSIYSKRNIWLWLWQESLLKANAGTSCLFTVMFREIRSVDPSGIRRVENLLAAYDVVFKLLGESYLGEAVEENTLIADIMDEFVIVKIKCLLLVRCGDLLLSLRKFADAQKVFERVTNYCKDLRYRKYFQHSLIYAQAVSGHAMILTNAKQATAPGPSPQSLLAIEMLREAYFSCSHVCPSPAARHLQLYIVGQWAQILILTGRIEQAKVLLQEEVARLSMELEVVSTLSADFSKKQVIGNIHSFYPSFVQFLASILREAQLAESGGIAGMQATGEMLKGLYHRHISMIKSLIGENDVSEAMMILSLVEELGTPSRADCDLWFLDDEEDELHLQLEEDAYMERATLLITALDIFRWNYNHSGADAMLHGISLILRRQAKMSMLINRTHDKKIEMAKSSLESAMDVFRDMGGVGYVVDLADVQAELGRVLVANNEQSEAISLFSQALDLYRQLFGDQDVRVGEYSYRKAVALQDLKLFEESEPFINDAITIFNLLPAGTKKGRALAACYSIKGFSHQELEEFDEAKEAYKTALQICGRMFGKDGIEMSALVAKIFNNLASVATSTGDTEEARALYEATVVMLKKQGREESIQMLIVLENLEQLLRKEGLIDNADFFKTRADELTEKLCDDMEKRDEMLKEREKQREDLYKQKLQEAGIKNEDEGSGDDDDEEEEDEPANSAYRCLIM